MSVLLTSGLCSLLTAEHVNKLHAEKISTVNDFVDTDPATVANHLAISYAEALALRTVLLAQCAPPIESGLALFDRTRRFQFLLPTKVVDLDELLDGGVFSNQVYQLTGPPLSGKSQFCMHMALQAAIKHNLRVLVIDAACSFDLCRVEQLLSANYSDSERKLVQRIELLREHVDNIEQLATLLEQFLDQKTKRGESSAVPKRKSAASRKSSSVLEAAEDRRIELLWKRRSVRLLIVDSLSVFADPRMDALDKRSQFAATFRRVQTVLKAIAASGCIVLCTIACRHPRADTLTWRNWSDAAHSRLQFLRVDSPLASLPLADAPSTSRDARQNSTVIQCRLVASCRQKTGSQCTFRIDDCGLA